MSCSLSFYLTLFIQFISICRAEKKKGSRPPPPPPHPPSSHHTADYTESSKVQNQEKQQQIKRKQTKNKFRLDRENPSLLITSRSGGSWFSGGSLHAVSPVST